MFKGAKVIRSCYLLTKNKTKKKKKKQFGAVLDMVTDRVATNALVIVLSHFFPRYLVAFMMLCCLDLGLFELGSLMCFLKIFFLFKGSHWFRMYSSLVEGSSSHKNTKGDGFLLNLYYNNRIVLGGLCLLNELFYVALYALHFYPESKYVLGIIYVCAPFFVLKQYISAVQLIKSCMSIAQKDAEEVDIIKKR